MAEGIRKTLEETYDSLVQRRKFTEDKIKTLDKDRSKAERKARTHLLIQIGGMMIKHFPCIDHLSVDDINDLIYHMSVLPEVSSYVGNVLKDVNE